MKTRYALLLALSCSAATYAGTWAWNDPLFRARVSTAILGFQNPVPSEYQATDTIGVRVSDPDRARTLHQKSRDRYGAFPAEKAKEAGKDDVETAASVPPASDQMPCAVAMGPHQSIDDAAPGGRLGDGDELHVVGIYEPTSSRRDSARRRSARR